MVGDLSAVGRLVPVVRPALDVVASGASAVSASAWPPPGVVLLAACVGWLLGLVLCGGWWE